MRTSIHKLEGRKIAKIKQDSDKPQYLVFYSDAGRVIFSVHMDQLFDRDGNRFEIDL